MSGVESTPPQTRGFLGRLACHRRRHRNPSSPPQQRGCLFRRSGRKAVRFANKVDSDRSTGTRTPRVVRGPSIRGVRVSRSASRKTFYTAVSSRRSPSSTTSASPGTPADDESDSVKEDAIVSTQTEQSSIPPLKIAATCACTFPQHITFCAIIPIVTAPNVEPGSYDELLILAKSIVGTWVTILERSQSLDEHMTYVGIGKMKRVIMNKLAIPFTAELRENDTLLQGWITTPVGQKHTRASLVGKETFDADADLGDWTAITKVVDYSIAWFCDGKSVRAMQMERRNPKLGLCYETRVVLPDQAEGRVLLYNFTMHPPEESGKAKMSVDRIFKSTK
eukprot:Protomagalhaensia_wolfi_Nauph_80__838@NODE_1485_length_1506_cov_1198_683708_g1151_i0_p1_GENE_NODE_1485_length_1506_cov_1198_683708_g1151_i0NODE_1485_length_1506_cov_1198_683708_g1151_i0_p1_ORF_typecomplete_len336_score36_50_NODE_1485_length_1506_cov_1198_683708_g1151_i02121219